LLRLNLGYLPDDFGFQSGVQDIPRGDIFKNDIFTKIFAIINLEYTSNYQSFMKYNKLIRLKIEDTQ